MEWGLWFFPQPQRQPQGFNREAEQSDWQAIDLSCDWLWKCSSLWLPINHPPTPGANHVCDYSLIGFSCMCVGSREISARGLTRRAITLTVKLARSRCQARSPAQEIKAIHYVPWEHRRQGRSDPQMFCPLPCIAANRGNRSPQKTAWP